LFFPSNWSGELDKDIIKKYFKGKRWPCFNLWKNIEIDADGNVIKCHGDHESVAILGNLINEDYNKISQIKNEIKLKQLNGDFSTAICNTCENYSSVDWWE
jgi:radical SAM protein with 4Fe4S-binding SPASM domain